MVTDPNLFDPALHTWEKLALEFSSRGFDYEKARQVLEIQDNFDVMAMIAIGKRGEPTC